MSLPGADPGSAEKIGPGRLILVVGPSGAGKDTLLTLVGGAARHEGVIVARRVVTRPGNGAEDHDSLSDEDFDAAVSAGAFTVWWGAHGNRYGIPASVEAAIKARRTVLCNVSRGSIADFKARFARVAVVLVTAPADVLAQRLAARARASDGSVAARLARSEAAEFRVEPDLVIDNVNSAEAAAQKFLDFVRKI